MSHDSDVYHNFHYAQLDVIIEVISTWPDFNRHTEKWRRLWNDVVEKRISTNHGDFWLNNVMVKVANAGASFENVIFIDFQDSCWASPAIDCIIYRTHHFVNRFGRTLSMD